MNDFVDFINQFYSQSEASSDAAYAERSTKNLNGINLKISKLIGDIKNEKVTAVILTGNAGDGKTFLCKQIFKEITGKDLPNQEISIAKFNSKTLRVIKDASEVEEDALKDVVAILEERVSSGFSNEKRSHLSQDIIIIAGNEGKLSQLFEKKDGLFSLLMKALRTDFYSIKENESFENSHSGVEIVNFNWRALVVDEAFESILMAFLSDNEWQFCKNCDDHDKCPIFFNARVMKIPTVLERLKILFKFLHYLEGHFTLREFFSALAYFITAGKNCRQIKELLHLAPSTNNEDSPVDYYFYNNVFAVKAGFRELEDKILNLIRRYDVAYAPLPILNNLLLDYFEEMNNYMSVEEDESQLFIDLLHIKEFKKQENADASSRLHDYLKRRFFFLPVGLVGLDKAWPSQFAEGNGQLSSIQGEDFLPFKGFKFFDDFMSGVKQDKEQVKNDIVKGLNLMMNRHDPWAQFFLKAYKPQRYGQTYSLEIRNELVEDLEVTLDIENPLLRSEYIEFLPRRLSLSVKKEPSLRFEIDIEMYELLYSVVKGNQARHSFRDILGIIEDFREAFYYRILKKIDNPKFGLNTAHKSTEAIEIAAKKSEIRIKKVQ